jgi:hypothetical protein
LLVGLLQVLPGQHFLAIQDLAVEGFRFLVALAGAAQQCGQVVAAGLQLLAQLGVVDLFGKLLADGDGLLEGAFRLVEAVVLLQQDAQVVLATAQLAARIGPAGVAGMRSAWA